MKKKMHVIIGFICFLSFFSCKGQAGDSSKQNSLSRKSIDSVTREIPLNRKAKPDLLYLFVKQEASQLGLDSLEAGYDSLQLRIWFDYSLARNKHLVIITRKNGIWNCQLFRFEVKWNLKADSQLIVNKTIKQIEPPMGWGDFVNELFSLNIANLPTGPRGGMDGANYNIEVATKHQYRFYEYWSPETTEEKFWGSKNMVKIIELLENECNFKRSQK